MDQSLENKINLEEILPAILLKPVFRRLKSKEILNRLLRDIAMKLQNTSFIVMKKNAICAVRVLKHAQRAFMF